jgi:Ca-activated chloride channel family protein
MYATLRRTAAAAALLLAAWTAPALADGPPNGASSDVEAGAAVEPSDYGPNETNAVQGDRTLSPYFAVENAEPGVDALPLKSTKVEVRILGVIADVRIVQQYRNTGRKPLEAHYLFPGSTRAAVHALTMRLGDRVLTAKIKEKSEARAEYEAGRKAGKTAALLSQHRENVFQMDVANVLPGDVIDVELRYTELIVPTDGRYQFVFPTVVGPRYNGPQGGVGPKSEPWLATPYLRAGKRSNVKFDLQVELATPIAVQEAISPSHTISLVPGRDGATLVRLAAGEAANDRDFVLDYRLAGDRLQTGLLLSKGTDENFFLAMVEPPARVPAGLIVPRDYVFVVDTSGSMDGFPLDTARTLMQDLLGNLRPSDTFNLVLFAGDSRVFATRSVAATRPNVDAAIDVLMQRGGGGGTELVPALRRALALPLEKDRARSIVVVTDGYVGVERETFDLIRRNLANANLFAFGIGSSVNRMLIEGMARAGHGEPFVVLNAKDAPDAAARFRAMIDSPVLTHVTAQFEGLDTYDVSPASLPDVFARRPIVLHGKWRGSPTGTLVVKGTTAAGAFEARIPVTPDAASPENQALRYLWARTRIAELSDQQSLEGGSDLREQILGLGLKYGLMTQYTSFVAVDELVRKAPDEAVADVTQSQPLPQGVSEFAVGTAVPATPEPETAALLAVLGVMGGFWLRRRSR